MLVEHIVNHVPVKSDSVKLMLGAGLSAILVSLGIIILTPLISLPVHPGLAASFGAIAAAIYSLRHRKNK